MIQSQIFHQKCQSGEFEDLKSSSGNAITSATPITELLSQRGETDGSITPGVYWFTNGEGGSYTFPVYVDNIDSVTWILMQKNFPPHANKNGDTNSGHQLSYGLMDSGGSAIVTSALANGSPDLGVKHARCHIDSFADATFTEMLGYSSDDYWHRFNNLSNSESVQDTSGPSTSMET